jgi:hypothetical protein
MASSHFSVYEYFALSENKSVLNLTPCATQLKPNCTKNIKTQLSKILNPVLKLGSLIVEHLFEL